MFKTCFQVLVFHYFWKNWASTLQFIDFKIEQPKDFYKSSADIKVAGFVYKSLLLSRIEPFWKDWICRSEFVVTGLGFMIMIQLVNITKVLW